MNVVNVKVQYIRPKYNNLSEFVKDSNNEYIGRKCIVFINDERYPKNDSEFANPFKAKDFDDDCIKLYEEYIRKKKLEDIIKLYGKTLGCWCKPKECHGDVLVKLINEYINIIDNGTLLHCVLLGCCSLYQEAKDKERENILKLVNIKDINIGIKINNKIFKEGDRYVYIYRKNDSENKDKYNLLGFKTQNGYKTIFT